MSSYANSGERKSPKIRFCGRFFILRRTIEKENHFVGKSVYFVNRKKKMISTMKKRLFSFSVADKCNEKTNSLFTSSLCFVSVDKKPPQPHCRSTQSLWTFCCFSTLLSLRLLLHLQRQCTILRGSEAVRLKIHSWQIEMKEAKKKHRRIVCCFSFYLSFYSCSFHCFDR